MLSERELTRRQTGLDIRGVIPHILASFDPAELINAYILDDIVDPLIAEARRLRARAISFSFEHHRTDEVASIVIYANVVTAMPRTLVRSVNFCVTSGRILTMNEATGIEIAPLAERILAEKIRANPERYYAALSSPLANQAFFLTEDKLAILFDGFRLSTRVGEVDSIELLLANITTVVLTEEEYRTDGPYGLKMIPLRDMFSIHLTDFEAFWDSANRRTMVRLGGIDIIELRADINEYIIHGTQRRSLEAAPQIIGGQTYVPITFFDQILPLTTYTIGFDGSITFLHYSSNR
jgi:hypothetical protein